MLGKKPQIIKLSQDLCHASFHDNDVLFVRISDRIVDKHACVEIRDGYNAYIIKGGSDVRFYKSGTEPIRIFYDKTEVKAWKQGFSVDVIYMSADASLSVKWGTPNKVVYRDAASNHVISVGASGTLEEFTITNHQQFFKKVIGARNELSIQDFKKRFLAVIVDDFAECFLKAVEKLKLTYDQFDRYRKEIASEIWGELGPYFENSWGCTFRRFIISEFAIDEGDKEAIEEASAEARKQQKFKEYLAELERLDDKQWERDKFLRRLEIEDRAAYYEVLKVIGHPHGGDKGGMTPKTATVYCPHCGQVLKGGDIFCPTCGKRVVKETVTCPHCGRANDGDATFCAACGHKLK